MPPKELLTMDFLRGVIQGTKRFLKLSEITIMDNVRRYPEICLPEIWKAVKSNDKLMTYFPDSILAANKPPNRTFLFTVLLIRQYQRFTQNILENLCAVWLLKGGNELVMAQTLRFQRS